MTGSWRRRRLHGGFALAAALLALAAWLPAQVDDATARAGGGTGMRTSPGGATTATAAAAVPPAAAPAALPAPVQPHQPAGAMPAVPITVEAPRTLVVGETRDLVVHVGSNARVGEVRFTVQLDPDILQVRAATEGDWASGAGAGVEPPRFAADIASAEDRVQVRSRVAGARPAGGGSVAVVQFQAVAPGTSSIVVSDVVVTDRAGNPVPFTLSSANLQVESAGPAPPPAAAAALITR